MNIPNIHEAVKQWLQANVKCGGLIPKNVRSYKWRIIEQNSVSPTLGMRIMPSSVEGKVVHINDEFTILKVERNLFAGVATQALSIKPPVLGEGVKVKITPHLPRDIDGIALDKPSLKDPEYGNENVTIIGMRQQRMDITPESQILRNLVQTLDEMAMPDGQRTLTSALITAGARRNNLQWVEDESKSIYYLQMRLATEKFAGIFRLAYQVAEDLYAVDLKPDDAAKPGLNHESLYFDELGYFIAHHIDDGQWRINKVELL